MKWVKDYDGDYINLDHCTCIFVSNKIDNPDYPWSVKCTHLNGTKNVLLKCNEEKTARAYLGRLMKKLGAI